MCPDGSDTKLRKEMRKQPLVLTTRSERGVQSGIGAINCVIPNRARLPIPPPIATKEYFLMETPIQNVRGKLARHSEVSLDSCQLKSKSRCHGPRGTAALRALTFVSSCFLHRPGIE